MTQRHASLSVIIRRSSAYSALRSWTRRPGVRIVLLVFAALLFSVGLFWAVYTLQLSPADLSLKFLFLLCLLMLPSLLYGGIGLVLLAKSLSLSIPLGRATTISAYAYLAELLPLPGGAIVRVGALMNAGGTIRKSTTLVVLTAVLWIALALVGAGLVLLGWNHNLAWPLLLLGSACSLGSVAWIWSISGAVTTIQTVAHRLMGILLMGVRIKFAFAALGTPIAFGETLPFALAILLGSASFIAPSGLGVSEALAALMATTGNHSSSLAFLATAIDRVFCLVACAIAVLLTQIRGHKTARTHASSKSG